MPEAEEKENEKQVMRLFHALLKAEGALNGDIMAPPSVRLAAYGGIVCGVLDGLMCSGEAGRTLARELFGRMLELMVEAMRGEVTKSFIAVKPEDGVTH